MIDGYEMCASCGGERVFDDDVEAIDYEDY